MQRFIVYLLSVKGNQKCLIVGFFVFFSHLTSESEMAKMSSQVLLRLLPSARCLFDEPIQVKVSGLRPRQVVTMRTRAMNERGVVFSASALYRADPSGEINLERDPSLGGSYTGVEPMGLLWSLKADAPHQYFHWNKVVNPHVVRFSVCDEEGEESRVLAEATNERYVISEGVSRVVVKGDNFQGVLFTPAGLSSSHE